MRVLHVINNEIMIVSGEGENRMLMCPVTKAPCVLYCAFYGEHDKEPFVYCCFSSEDVLLGKFIDK